MPFKDIEQGKTHHDKDACFKCPVCGDHTLAEEAEAGVVVEDEGIRGIAVEEIVLGDLVVVVEDDKIS